MSPPSTRGTTVSKNKSKNCSDGAAILIVTARLMSSNSLKIVRDQYALRSKMNERVSLSASSCCARSVEVLEALKASFHLV